MKKVFYADSQLKDILDLANIKSACIEITIHSGIVIIQPKKLRCALCGCTDEGKLMVRDHVFICNECSKPDAKSEHKEEADVLNI